MKTTFGLIVGLGILVSGMSVANAGEYGNSCSKRVVVAQPSVVYYSNEGCSYRTYYVPRYSWRSAYSKPRGYFGYRYYRRCR